MLVKTPYYNEGDFDVNEELSALVTNTTKSENATTFQGVLEHYKDNNPDMLCVVRRKRGFFTKIWEKNTILKKDFHSLNSCFSFKWFKINIGALAQLARAFGWQPKGHRFDSLMLHL